MDSIVTTTIGLFQSYAEIISYLAIIAASATAIWGINAWKREFKGKRQIELAEDVLALFYEAEQAIRAIRSPSGKAGEGKTRVPEQNESKEEKKIRDNAYGVWERYNQYKELFGRLYSTRFRFMAVFGPEATEPINDLLGIIHRILGASNKLGHLWRVQAGKDRDSKSYERHVALVEENRAIIWDSQDDEDPINEQLAATIKRMETTCRKVIGAPADANSG